MKSGQLYVALSDRLTDWAQDAGHLFLFKIGVTSDPSTRLRALNQGWPHKNSNGPCLGFTDWRWAERWHYLSRGQADDDEKRLKKFLRQKGWRTFDRTLSPHNDPGSCNGETEVFQIRLDQLPQLDELCMPQGTRRNDFTDAVVMAAIARHLRAELERVFPAVMPDDDELLDELNDDDSDDDLLDEDDEEFRRENGLFVGELMSNQDDYARSGEEGWHHSDDD